MDPEAIKTAVHEWILELVAHNPDYAWLRHVELTAGPAFLVDTTTKEGDDFKAGAVPIATTPHTAPHAGAVDQLYDALVADRTLGNRAKRAVFERPRHANEAGTIVVIPA